MMGSYTAEKAELQKRHEEVISELEKCHDAELDISAWLALMRKHEMEGM